MAGGRSSDDDARAGDGAVREDLGGLPTRSSPVSGRVARWSAPGLRWHVPAEPRAGDVGGGPLPATSRGQAEELRRRLTAAPSGKEAGS